MCIDYGVSKCCTHVNHCPLTCVVPGFSANHGELKVIGDVCKPRPPDWHILLIRSGAGRSAVSARSGPLRVRLSTSATGYFSAPCFRCSLRTRSLLISSACTNRNDFAVVGFTLHRLFFIMDVARAAEDPFAVITAATQTDWFLAVITRPRAYF